jgi:predicted permease
MIIVTLINSILLMACLMGMGYYLRKKTVLNDEAETSLTFILVNVTTPAMIINTLTIDFSVEQFKTGAILFVIAVLFDILLVILGKLTVGRISDKEKRTIFKFGIVMLNGGFMGYPIVNQMFGAEGMFYATMFHTPNIIFMWTYGMSLLIGKEKDKPRYKQMFLNPGVVAVYVGFLLYFTQVPIPTFAKSLLELLTNVTTVLAMIIIGSKIETIGIREAFSDKDSYYASFVRLILSPIAMLIVLKFLNFSDMVEQVYIIYAALPVAALMPILARKYNRDDAYASKIVVITHLISLITIPIFFWMYTIL